jgi:hypothetical protein
MPPHKKPALLAQGKPRALGAARAVARPPEAATLA